MASSRRQVATLAGLLLVLAAVLWWQARAGGPALPAAGSEAVTAALPAPASVPAQGPAGVAVRPADTIPAVALLRLDGDRMGVVDSGRDPFRFDTRVRRPSGDEPGAAQTGTAPSPQDRDRASGAVPVQMGAPPPPPIGLKFIGLVRRSSSGIVLAVLSDGKGVYYGTEGAVIEGRYRILKIGTESVEMAYIDGRGQQRIPLTGA